MVGIIARNWRHVIYKKVDAPTQVASLFININVSSAEDAWQTILGVLTKLWMNGKPIKVFGDGEQLRPKSV